MPAIFSTFLCAGANKGKYCSAFPLSNGVRETARSVSASLLAGSSCIKIGVETSGINAGQPDLTAPLPDAYSLSDVFPGLSNNIGTYSSQTTSTVAIDSQATVPCSTPQLSKAPTQGAVTGIVNKGTCNTASSFNNGGNNQNGIPSDTETCLALSTVVSSPIASPSPSPSSSPSPAPVPSPTAAPPSPVVPKPPPVSPTTAPPPPGSTLKCTYNGYYTISPAFAPCNTRYITFASPNNCSATAVTLNTKSQLGGKPVRIGWRLATSATGPVGVPNQITAQKGTCSARNLAGSIHSDGNLVLGGTHWTWQVVPAGKTSCTTVNLISQNRLADGSAFLNVAKTSSGACSNKFSWVSTNGGRAQFKLTKVSSAKSSGSG